MQTISLKNQKALVTGGDSGIGAGIIHALADAGASVLINFHEEDASDAEKIVASIKQKGGEAAACRADVSSERDVLELFDCMFKHFGTIDILVNNAGIQKDAPIEQMTLDDWQRVLAVNLTGQFLCAREAIREFKRRGVIEAVSKSAGKIICISSVHDVIPWAGRVNYAASKGGVMLLMRSLAQEVAADKIRVNSISPGAIKTSINKEAWRTPEAENKLLELIPYRRVGETEDIAKVACFLASDLGDYITGETIYVDGGMTLYPGFRDNG
ncbi:MAG: SDR family oxidoreductase [Burkholderiales bacterium]